MRIAFFGGSFDPPHCGHLAIARAAIDHLQLDRVLFAPVGTQPLKQELPPAGFDDRLAMVRLAIGDDPRLGVSLLDAPRADGQPNYTLRTLHELRQTLSPEDELFCLIGADSFLTLKEWHGAEDLLFACDFIVAGRPGFLLDNLGAALPEGVRVLGTPKLLEPDCLSILLESPSQRRSHLYVLPHLKIDISATEIRNALRAATVDPQGNGNGILPATVIAYIRAHGLYRHE
ncbi:MAG TPA: nicotinate (nicotinamide) nucleotide adenylyltransferase [Acidisarcina sp.]|nr:nicotinate (nicotinamide) nucleotide adenylyltransferase [Acidisarcina sp.]